MKTGYDINDPNKRLFKYDDMMVLTSLPPQYNAWYLDNNEHLYVICKNVITINDENRTD